jgi:Tfp pilus assembly protein PilX
MKKKGAALLVVVIIMMLTFFMAAIMIEVSIRNLRVSTDSKESTNAYYSAEAGIYDAINYIELMAAAGSFNSSYFNHNIPITNLYSKDENNGEVNNYLFGDLSASYTASIELLSPIVNDTVVDSNGVLVSTPFIAKIYNCKINSKGTYNNQSYLINDTVTIYYDSGNWKYSFVSKLSSKD